VTPRRTRWPTCLAGPAISRARAGTEACRRVALAGEGSHPVACAIYASKSTEDRRRPIPGQLRGCREAIEADPGHEVIAEYQDEAFSAYRRDRGLGLAGGDVLGVVASKVLGTLGLGFAIGWEAEHMRVLDWVRRGRIYAVWMLLCSPSSLFGGW
jgi:hypothetical protein